MKFSDIEEDKTFVAPDMFSLPMYDEVIDKAVRTDKLPFDTWFRLRTVGAYQPDWMQSDASLSRNIGEDIAKNIDDPSEMRPDSHRLLWGEIPDAVVDVDHYTNRFAYPKLETMYYRLPNLARIIKRQRSEAGQTIAEVPERWYVTPEEYENSRCFGLARPIWRTIIQRIHPEWLKNPEYYWSRTQYTIHGSYYELGDHSLRRRVIDAAVISDEVVYDIYDESVRTGVKGIGPKGRESLRDLLAEEHPELM